MEFTPELFAANLARLLDHVNWPRITLAGCSMGGCIAQAFAGVYPEPIECPSLIAEKILVLIERAREI